MTKRTDQRDNERQNHAGADKQSNGAHPFAQWACFVHAQDKENNNDSYLKRTSAATLKSRAQLPVLHMFLKSAPADQHSHDRGGTNDGIQMRGLPTQAHMLIPNVQPELPETFRDLSIACFISLSSRTAASQKDTSHLMATFQSIRGLMKLDNLGLYRSAVIVEEAPECSWNCSCTFRVTFRFPERFITASVFEVAAEHLVSARKAPFPICERTAISDKDSHEEQALSLDGAVTHLAAGQEVPQDWKRSLYNECIEGVLSQDRTRSR